MPPSRAGSCPGQLKPSTPTPERTDVPRQCAPRRPPHALPCAPATGTVRPPDQIRCARAVTPARPDGGMADAGSLNLPDREVVRVRPPFRAPCLNWGLCTRTASMTKVGRAARSQSRRTSLGPQISISCYALRRGRVPDSRAQRVVTAGPRAYRRQPLRGRVDAGDQFAGERARQACSRVACSRESR